MAFGKCKGVEVFHPGKGVVWRGFTSVHLGQNGVLHNY